MLLSEQARRSADMNKEWNDKYDQQDLQRLRGLRLMDDDFMSKCFENNIECTELVLHIVLGRDDLKVEKVETQHLIKNLQGRSIILDSYATEHTGKRYNIEIQRADRGAGAKRARYHSSLIDANITEPGDRLENLSETYVIFITERDVMGDALPIYHINRMFINNLLPMISENLVVNPEAWEKLSQSQKNEFGPYVWGTETIAQEMGIKVDRTEAPSYDMFEL